MKLHIANIPLLPKVFRNSWPIGNGKSEFKRSVVDVVAKDAAMKRIQPTISVKSTPTMMAIGAAREAPATSSDMWAAESSDSQLTMSIGLKRTWKRPYIRSESTWDL